jgi:hypothetical protein
VLKGDDGQLKPFSFAGKGLNHTFSGIIPGRGIVTFESNGGGSTVN